MRATNLYKISIKLIRIYFCIGLLTPFNQNYLIAQKNNIYFQTLKDGLSHPQIRCILKDSKGFMWFGSDGLNKFDGSNFTIYNHNSLDSNSLCHNTVNALIEDNKNNIWVGTADGLCLYNRDKDNFKEIEAFGNWDIINVRSLLIDENDILWVGTYGIGLFLYDLKNARMKQFTHDSTDINSISSDDITCIISDNDGNKWISTRKGLNLFDHKDSTFTRFVANNNNRMGISHNNINALTLDKAGNIWIGTYGGGLNKLSKKNGGYLFSYYQKTNRAGSIAHNNILCLCSDHDDNIWIGTENGGLSCLLNGSDEFINYGEDVGNPKSIGSNSIWSIYEDNLDILWIGTYNNGLSIVDKNYEKFKHIQRNITKVNTLVNNHVTSFSEDDRGNIIVATDGGGISYLNTNTWQFENKIDNSSLSSQAVMDVLFDSKQNIWIGTWAGGIDRFTKNGKKIKNYRIEDGSVEANNIKCIYEDKKGTIWAGTSGRGLFVYDPDHDSFIEFAHNNKTVPLSSTAFISDILEDSDNNIWVGTLFGLVSMKRTEHGNYQFKQYMHSSDPNSISGFTIICLFEDSKKNIWVGTQEGLDRFNKDEGVFSAYIKQNGLPSNTINGILEDDKGNLWISTNLGISKFDPVNETFKNFTKEDGLNTNDFNGRSCIRTKSGEFYFGGNNGINLFYPDSIKMNSFIPPVYITGLQFLNSPGKNNRANFELTKNISETSNISLKYFQNSFTIEFVALNYTRSEKNEYAYMLEGFEENWNYVGNRKIATYTNLNPGNYTFKVKGSNNDAIWNDTPKELHITISPPYWKTTWAYLAYSITFSIILFGFVRLLIIRAKQAEKLRIERVKHEKDEELNKLKTQFFTNISHELRTPLSLIISPLEQIISDSKQKGQSKSLLSLVYRNVEKLYRLVNELMEFTKSEESKLKMKVERDDIVRFIKDIFYLFTDKAQRKYIDYRFITNKEKIFAWFDKNKMEKIILNLISNAFKFTRDKGRIIVKIEQITTNGEPQPERGNVDSFGIKEIVKISIIDNGSGISPQYIDKVFDRFFQNPEDNYSSHIGTGIGLALVKNLVLMHQGEIKVESEKWKKTCFTITLPLGNTHFDQDKIITGPDVEDNSYVNFIPIEEKKSPEKNYSNQKHPLLLLVEDNEELRKYLVSILSGNYKILEASNGISGYRKALKFVPDLIISDILMAGVPGTDMCKKIKENINTSHIPVILLTAKATIEDRIEGIETGADMYITKPFNVNYLESTIKNLIETRKKLFKRFSQDVYILPKEITGNKRDEDFLEKTIKFIDSNILNENLSLEEISSHLNLSPSQTYRKIKALTGQTVVEFINTIRLKNAIKLFESNKYNISEVAYNVGFNSPAYFTKCFKNQFGKSPSAFIAEQKMIT